MQLNLKKLANGLVLLIIYLKIANTHLRELPLYEIGWRLIPEVWGNGLATEGATAVLHLPKKGIEAIYSFYAENNLPSRKVMEKLA